MSIAERIKATVVAPSEAKLIASVALGVAVIALAIAIGSAVRHGR